MRILDRQRYWAFLKAYVICFTALVGLYIVIDAFSNFDEFTKRASGAAEIFQIMGRYYLVHMTEFYDRLCGVIGMMAAIFTVTWMQKNNELLAMLAAGISTQRVIRPVIVASVLVSGLAVANQEWVMPGFADELMKSHDDDGNIKLRIAGRYDANMVYIHGDEADRKTQTILNFFATVPENLYGVMYNVEARQARYIPETDRRSPLRGGWLLRGASLQNQLPPTGPDAQGRDLLVKVPDLAWFPPAYGDNPALAVTLQALRGMYPAYPGLPPPYGDNPILGGETYFLRSALTFKAVTRKRQWYQYAPTVELVRGLTDPANRGERLDIAVFLHNRLLRPCLALALLFLTLPQVLGGYGRNMFINLGLSLGTAAGFYGLNFMSQYLGAHEVIPPELSAWAPLIAFGTFAVYRWDAIRT